METLLLRHGIAEDLADADLMGKGDPARRLTKDGREKAARIAHALQKRVSIDLIVHSPYVRAQETAEIFAAEFPQAGLQPVQGLTPHDAPRAFVPILRELQKRGAVMVVGHEPHLSGLASYLLTGRDQRILEFKKAGVAAIDWDEPGMARLQFFISPKFV